MSVQPDIDGMTFTELVGDFEVPCDLREGFPWTAHSTIRWAAWRVKCVCGRPAAVACICDNCKDQITLTDAALACFACGEVYAPARTFISRIEAL